MSRISSRRAGYAASDSFHAHLLDQYKLCVEMADRISARRMLTNNMYMLVVSAVASAYALVPEKMKDSPTAAPLQVVLAVCAFVGAFIWLRALLYYFNLNKAKYEVIHEMEAELPMDAMKREFELFCDGNKRGWAKRKGLGKVEMLMPMVAMAVASVAFVFAMVDTWTGKSGQAVAVVRGFLGLG